MALEPTRIPAMSLMAPTKMFAAPAMSTVRPVADCSAMSAPASSGSLTVRVSRGFLPARSRANIAVPARQVPPDAFAGRWQGRVGKSDVELARGGGHDSQGLAHP